MQWPAGSKQRLPSPLGVSHFSVSLQHLKSPACSLDMLSLTLPQREATHLQMVPQSPSQVYSTTNSDWPDNPDYLIAAQLPFPYIPRLGILFPALPCTQNSA